MRTRTIIASAAVIACLCGLLVASSTSPAAPSSGNSSGLATVFGSAALVCQDTTKCTAPSELTLPTCQTQPDLNNQNEGCGSKTPDGTSCTDWVSHGGYNQVCGCFSSGRSCAGVTTVPCIKFSTGNAATCTTHETGGLPAHGTCTCDGATVYVSEGSRTECN
jgi:hypothetical protein